MIPKTIHYCWFSGSEMPPFIKKCISSWNKHMPDYRLRLWDAKSFDFNSVPFVKEAYEAKKWAFVSDYIRLYALYTEGGIYLDSDVRVFKAFDEWLSYDLFSGIEYHPGVFEAYKTKIGSDYLPEDKDVAIGGLGINGAIIASKPKHPYLKDCLDVYKNLNFKAADGSLNTKDVVIGLIISKVAEKYGFIYKNEQQRLKENMLILSADILVGNALFLSDNSYAIHLCNGSWVEKSKYESFLYTVRNRYPRIYPLFGLMDKVFNKLKRILYGKK